MKAIIAALAVGLTLGTVAGAYAKLPPAPPKSEADKKAEADKAAATKAKQGAELGKAQDKAVANYKKNKGVSMDTHGKKK